MASSLPPRGTLADVSLPRLLVETYRDRIDGSLELRRRRLSKRFRLADGIPVEVESDRESEGLVAGLVESGRLPEEAAERLRAQVQRGRGKEAAALVQLRLLAPREVLQAIQEQVRRALLDCFSWADGEYALEVSPGDVPLPPVRNDPIALVVEGLRIHWRPERLVAELGAQLARWVTCPEATDRVARAVERQPGGAALLQAMDGSRILEAALPSPDPTVALRLAWILEAAGSLVAHDAPVAPAATETPEEPPAAEPETEEIEIVVESSRANASGSPAGASAPSSPSRREPPSQAPGAQEARLRREIEEKHARLGELDHYALLGVGRDATEADIKRAYFAAAKRFHPDGLVRLGLENLRSQANEVFAQIAKARDVLADPRARRDYEATLEGGASLDGDRLVQAEMLFRKGEILLRAGNFRGAVEFFHPAVELWPMEGAYQAYLGWALFRRSPRDAKAARVHLERAVSLDPRLAEAHLWLGAVLKEQGETEAAARCIARAHDLDPKLR